MPERSLDPCRPLEDPAPRPLARALLRNGVGRLRELIPAHGGDLLNATVRDVRADGDSVLAYAPGDRLALVLLFNQALSEAGEKHMRAMTTALIDAALDHGGTYYLPYRPHATRAQFEAAYPAAARALDLKRRFDPDGLFRNEFYRNYLEPR